MEYTLPLLANFYKYQLKYAFNDIITRVLLKFSTYLLKIRNTPYKISYTPIIKFINH